MAEREMRKIEQARAPATSTSRKHRLGTPRVQIAARRRRGRVLQAVGGPAQGQAPIPGLKFPLKVRPGKPDICCDATERLGSHLRRVSRGRFILEFDTTQRRQPNAYGSERMLSEEEIPRGSRHRQPRGQGGRARSPAQPQLPALNWGISAPLAEAIVDGEVMDRQLVTDAIANLFDSRGIKSRSVVPP
jgi:hypothetical protein